jgi:hypothetical protein
MQVEVAGTCSDTTADPVEVNINGTRYYIRTSAGAFARKFPIAPGKNTVIVECRNQVAVGRATVEVHGANSAVPLKVVLTSDTDGVYTDLHIYEPDGSHVYWADTESPSGGVFYLNSQGDSFDQPGYGPYLFVHPSPPVGVYRIDANYWPGGAIQHTLSNLDLIMNEGTPTESRRRVRRPLARPGETATLAYLVIRGNQQPPVIYAPGQDPVKAIPPEVVEYQKTIEPKLKQENSEGGGDYAALLPADESAMRSAVVQLALQQAVAVSPAWDPKQRDCAGLVRFTYREALKARSPEQRGTLRVPSILALPAVSEAARRQFAEYPAIWQTGWNAEGKERFGLFADAETLVGFNFRKVSSTAQDAEPGDLLVYQKPIDSLYENVSTLPYHLMMVAGSLGSPKERERRLVYHTGAFDGMSAIRVVTLGDLERSPDPTWQPITTNQSFLGVFRWNKFRNQPVVG